MSSDDADLDIEILEELESGENRERTPADVTRAIKRSVADVERRLRDMVASDHVTEVHPGWFRINKRKT
jgi:hypothetical protein